MGSDGFNERRRTHEGIAGSGDGRHVLMNRGETGETERGAGEDGS